MLRFFVLVLLALSLNAFPQTIVEKRISVEAIGINKGLSQGMINCIWQDKLGFMWFGTIDGLNRYDGYKFQVFRNNTVDSTSLSGNFITSIFQDSRGRLWIGTALNGLNLFMPETEQFIHFTTGSKPAVSNNTIFSIQEDKFGAIWIGTQYGLNKLTVHEPDNRERVSLTSPAESICKPSLISIKQITLTGAGGEELFKTTASLEPNFLIAKNGDLWVSTTAHLYKIVPSKNGQEIISKQDSLLMADNKIKVADDHLIYKIVEDTANSLLCFKGLNGFMLLDENSGKITHWNCAPLDISAGRNQVVFNDGLLWERTGNGLFCFDMARKKMYHVFSYSPEHQKIISLPFSLYKDKSEIIWIGSGGYGLLKYNPRTEAFHKTITASITGMSAAADGSVLVLADKPLQLRKDKSGSQPVYRSDETVPKKILNLIKQYPDITLQSPDGSYWLHANGAIQRTLGLRSVQTIKTAEESVFPYFLDKSDRLCYVSQQRFCIVDKTTSKVIYYLFPVPLAAASPYRFCQVIYQDTKGVFWLGTTEGLFCFTEATGVWQHYRNKQSDSASLSTNIVFSIADDPQAPGDYLWVGTNGGGLNRLCISTGKFSHIGIKEGLPNMVVYGILTDDDKQLWISTNNGLACLKPQYSADKGGILHRALRYYYEENGLQSNEFNRYSSCKTADGFLFFGGVNGFNYFNPEEVISNPVMPAVVITDFKINNKPVLFYAPTDAKKNSAKALLSKPVFVSETIEVPYKDNIISFDFASLDYTASEKNLYKYKMVGFDKEWIESGNTHSATYTNLDPGIYTFMVSGSNSDGVWNETGTSIRLTILAPWYMTWWFRVAVILIVAALVYAIFQNRLQQKLKLLDIRNGIASDLHDEIGSTLSSIYIYSEVAQQGADVVNPQTTTYLKQISADTGNMISALSDIVWTVNAKNDRFENIIHRMRAAAVELFEAKGYNLHLEFTGQLNTLQLPMAKRKHFYLFYKEATNNAAKYAEGKNVWITLTYTKPLICLSVKDDGQGFALSDKRSGNGLATMQKRANELKGSFKLLSALGAGTEVQLSFPA